LDRPSLKYFPQHLKIGREASVFSPFNTGFSRSNE
jgi:hypothetical protein